MNIMKRLALVAATAAAIFGAVPLMIGTTQAVAQVGVDIGPRGGGVYVGPDHRHHCKTVTITEWRHGARVTAVVPIL